MPAEGTRLRGQVNAAWDKALPDQADPCVRFAYGL